MGRCSLQPAKGTCIRAGIPVCTPRGGGWSLLSLPAVPTSCPSFRFPRTKDEPVYGILFVCVDSSASRHCNEALDVAH